MIVLRRRLSVTDMAMVFLASLVLGSGLMSRRGGGSPTLQVVHVQSDVETVHSYTLPTGDHRLARIEHRIAQYDQPSVHPLLGTNRWIAETSRFYAGSQHSGDSAVVDRMAVAGSWQRIARSADQRIMNLEQHSQSMIENAGPPPVSLGPTVGRAPSRSTLLVSFVGAILVLGILSLWTFFCPSRCFDFAAKDSSDLLKRENEGLPIDLSPDWIHLHQTFAAKCRGCFTGGWVIAGIVAVVLV